MPQRNDVAIFVFQLCSLKPDADLCMCMDLPLEKNCGKSGLGHRALVGRGPRDRGGRYVMYGDIYCTEYIAL